jgi:hypothetical protein
MIQRQHAPFEKDSAIDMAVLNPEQMAWKRSQAGPAVSILFERIKKASVICLPFDKLWMDQSREAACKHL